MIVDEEYAIIGDRLAYSTIESAEIAAEDFGCQGHHEHEFEGRIWYMPCEKHSLKLPCQEGYEQIGMKDKDGRKVPNCVPIK